MRIFNKTIFLLFLFLYSNLSYALIPNYTGEYVALDIDDSPVVVIYHADEDYYNAVNDVEDNALPYLVYLLNESRDLALPCATVGDYDNALLIDTIFITNGARDVYQIIAHYNDQTEGGELGCIAPYTTVYFDVDFYIIDCVPDHSYDETIEECVLEEPEPDSCIDIEGEVVSSGYYDLGTDVDVFINPLACDVDTGCQVAFEGFGSSVGYALIEGITHYFAEGNYVVYTPGTSCTVGEEGMIPVDDVSQELQSDTCPDGEQLGYVNGNLICFTQGENPDPEPGGDGTGIADYCLDNPNAAICETSSNEIEDYCLENPTAAICADVSEGTNDIEDFCLDNPTALICVSDIEIDLDICEQYPDSLMCQQPSETITISESSSFDTTEIESDLATIQSDYQTYINTIISDAESALGLVLTGSNALADTTYTIKNVDFSIGSLTLSNKIPSFIPILIYTLAGFYALLILLGSRKE